MSVLFPIISSIDGTARRVYLKEGVSGFFPIEDIYHEYRNLRRTDESLRKFEALLRAEGNIAKGGGAFTPRYVVLLNGTKIVPFNETLQVNQLGDMITDDPDTDPSLYDVTTLTVPKVIYIKPSEAETIQLNSGSIEYSSFDGGVWIDQANGLSGVDGLKGNAQFPVNNIPDAVSITNTRGLPNTAFVIGDLVIGVGDNVSGFELIGQNPARSSLTINDLSNTLNTAIRQVELGGFLDGNTIVRDCNVGDITYFSGEIHDSQILSKITLGNNAQANIVNCSSGIAGQTTPEIDFGGSGQSLVLSGFRQGIKFINKTGEDPVSVSLDGGQVRIDLTTVTNGHIVVRGVGRVVDDATGDWLPHGTYGNLILDNETTYGLMLQELWTAHGLDADVDATEGTVIKEIHSEVQYIERWIHLDTEQLIQGIGTQAKPFNTLDAALTYMEANNFLRLHTVSDLTIDRQLKNFVVIGIGNPSVDFNGQNLDGSEFQNCTLKGLKTGVITADNCDLFEGVQVQGRVRRCAFLGTVEQTGDTDYSGCYSGITGLGYPQLKITAGNAGVRGFIGSIGVTGVTSGDHSIGIGSDGRLLADATCTGGSVHFRGFPFEIVDNSGVGCSVFDETESEKVSSIPITSSGLTTEESTKLLSLPQKEDNATHLLKEVQLIVGN